MTWLFLAIPQWSTRKWLEANSTTWHDDNAFFNYVLAQIPGIFFSDIQPTHATKPLLYSTLILNQKELICINIASLQVTLLMIDSSI